MGEEMMENKIGGYILALFILMLLCVLLTGCDKIPKCRPQIDLKTGYVGIVCGGDW